MSKTTRHLRVGILATLGILLACSPLSAIAATTAVFSVSAAPKIVITEMQTTAGTASQEFVEFYNTTDSDIDLADSQNSGKTPWKLQFFSASSTATGQPDWTKPSATVALTGVIAAHDYFLLSSTGYAPGGIEADESYSSRLSDIGGGIQLVTANTVAITAYDRLMWKQPADGQTLPKSVMATPPANGSLQRLPNDNNEYVNSDNTLTDFVTADTITPKDIWQPPVILPEPAPAEDTTSPQSANDGTTTESTTEVTSVLTASETGIADTPAVNNTGLTSPYITELLPNPAAPLTDSHDEFIEIYNPNDAPFDLKGYSLEVGNTTLHDFTLTSSTVIAPLSYMVFYSADTSLSLANSDGQARLLDASGNVVNQTDPYSAAKDGEAWVLSDGTWQWSTTPTPGMTNTLTAPIVAAKASAKTTTASKATTATAAKKATAKTAAAKVKGTSSTKTAKAKKAATKKPAKAKIATVADTQALPAKTPIHTQVLVVVAVLAVLYAGYEYRTDISNRFFQFRRNRTIRKIFRLQA